jgi:hypothetical protein
MDQHGASGVATAAKDQAGQVGQTAARAGGQVAQTTKEQAQNVVGEARQQARDLVGEARTQVSDQAGQQKGRAVDGLRALADELDQMAQQGGQSGIATEVARQAAQRVHGLADYLDRHEPTELLDQVRAYARRRPVVFLTGAAVLGVLAGRMTRSLASGDDSGPRQLTGAPTTAQLPASSTHGGGAGYPAGYAEPAYLVGAEATAGGYELGYGSGREPGYGPGGESGYGSGGFRPTGEPGYPATGEPGYPTGEPGYPGGGSAVEEPGARPSRDHEGGTDDPAWRTP